MPWSSWNPLSQHNAEQGLRGPCRVRVSIPLKQEAMAITHACALTQVLLRILPMFWAMAPGWKMFGIFRMFEETGTVDLPIPPFYLLYKLITRWFAKDNPCLDHCLGVMNSGATLPLAPLWINYMVTLAVKSSSILTQVSWTCFSTCCVLHCFPIASWDRVETRLTLEPTWPGLISGSASEWLCKDKSLRPSRIQDFITL